jgi:hypothetical protein
LRPARTAFFLHESQIISVLKRDCDPAASVLEFSLIPCGDGMPQPLLVERRSVRGSCLS